MQFQEVSFACLQCPEVEESSVPFGTQEDRGGGGIGLPEEESGGIEPGGGSRFPGSTRAAGSGTEGEPSR